MGRSAKPPRKQQELAPKRLWRSAAGASSANKVLRYVACRRSAAAGGARALGVGPVQGWQHGTAAARAARAHTRQLSAQQLQKACRNHSQRPGAGWKQWAAPWQHSGTAAAAVALGADGYADMLTVADCCCCCWAVVCRLPGSCAMVWSACRGLGAAAACNACPRRRRPQRCRGRRWSCQLLLVWAWW